MIAFGIVKLVVTHRHTVRGGALENRQMFNFASNGLYQLNARSTATDNAHALAFQIDAFTGVARGMSNNALKAVFTGKVRRLRLR